MCEKLDSFNVGKKEKSLISNETLHFQHQKIQKKVEIIHKKERVQQITDFLSNNKEVGKDINLTFDEVVDCLAKHTKNMLDLDDNYSLWDENIEDVNTILVTYHQNSLNHKKAESTTKEKSSATNLKSYISQEKQLGKSNIQIMKSILEQEEQGVLKVSPNKITQYKNLLALAHYSGNTTDKTPIYEIINHSENALLNEGSFENIVLSIYEDDRVSTATKIKIQQEFDIKPIQTGGDLRNALKHQNQLIQEQEKQLNKFNTELKKLDNYQKNLDQKIYTLQEKLTTTTNIEERTQLHQKLQDAEDELQKAKAKHKLTYTNHQILEKNKPTKNIYLRGHQAQLQKGLIHIKNPLKENSIKIPIESNNKEIGEIANTLFLYQTLDDLGAATLIFPDEKFGNSHLPSKSMIRFSNEILAALNLRHSGLILSKDELNTLITQIKRCQISPTQKQPKSKIDFFRKDFQELGILEGGIFIKHKFLNLLQLLSTLPNKNVKNISI